MAELTGVNVLEFVGRDQELADLSGVLDQVRSGVGGRAPGQCIQMRGRRRIGKSSLVEEFLLRAKVPAIFFTAERRAESAELQSFWQTVIDSPWAGAEEVSNVTPRDFSGAFNALAAAMPDDEPTVLIIDEVPYLIEQIPAFEAILQRAWDRKLSRKPVLLILIGSDLAMMEALNSYDRPFHQRGREMIIGPLTPAAVADMLQLSPADAFDAALVTGGLPLICQEWGRGQSPTMFVSDSVANPLSALIVSGERSLAAEFPPTSQASSILRAIGSGERTFSNIARAAGDIPHSSLTRALEVLTDKRIVAADLPLGLGPSKDRRYRITDSYLRFWLSFIEPNQALIERRRPDLAAENISRSWSSWRGRAIEPLLRESLARLLPDRDIPAAAAVGSYWTRNNSVEIDIVGADRGPIAKQLLFLGSIKWRDDSPFDERDEFSLQRHRAAITDDPVPLIAITRTDTDSSPRRTGLTAAFDPSALLQAWR